MVPAAASITKPFHYPELLARIGAILARVSRSRDREVIRHGELTVNTLSREVTVGGIKVDLSAKEYQLLTTLAAEPGRVFTKAELLEMVWGFRSQGRTRTGEETERAKRRTSGLDGPGDARNAESQAHVSGHSCRNPEGRASA